MLSKTGTRLCCHACLHGLTVECSQCMLCTWPVPSWIPDSIPGGGQTIWVRIIRAHALRLISQTGKRVRRCLLYLWPFVAFKKWCLNVFKAGLLLKPQFELRVGVPPVSGETACRLRLGGPAWFESLPDVGGRCLDAPLGLPVIPRSSRCQLQFRVVRWPGMGWVSGEPTHSLVLRKGVPSGP